jgi:hypothetical protein
MGVQLIDPIEAIKQFPFANGVPEYERMFIFAELTAQRRGRSIILSSGNGTFSLERTINSDLTVNMLGPDKPTNTFTTNWSEATSATEDNFEGFGITRISVKINSSFVPVVTIDFLDIRGLAFFNSGSNSPYAVLHDFPPPMFDLTLKGYYGKSLTYQLHLIRQNTTFEGTSGNYKTTAEFVARTFAPLTDILFQYPRMFPLMETDTINIPAPQANSAPVGNLITSNRAIQPKGIFNLLDNIKNTYQQIDRLLQDSDEKEKIETKQKQRNDIRINLNEINRFATQLDNKSYNSNNTSLLIQKFGPDHNFVEDTVGQSLTLLSNIQDYQKSLKSTETTGVDYNNRLFLGIKLNDEEVTPTNLVPNISSNLYNNIQTRNALNTLDNYRKKLIGQYPKEAINELFGITSTGSESDINKVIPQAQIKFIYVSLTNSSTQNTNYKKTNYVTLDITLFYQKLFKYFTVQLEKEIDELQRDLGDRVNDITESNLEMKPTIKNIFKIICDDVDIFFNKLRNAAVKGQEHHNDPTNKVIITGNDDLPEEKNKVTEVDAFPLYIEQSVINDINGNCKTITRKQRAYPAKDGGISNQTTTPFPEVELVERFINTYIQIRNLELIDKLRNKQSASGDLVFIPSSPYDSLLGNPDAYQSPYVASSVAGGIGTGELTQEQIFNVLLNRFYVFSQYTYAESFYKEDNKNIKESLAKFGGESEASNIALSIVNTEVIDNMITLLNNYSTSDALFGYLSGNTNIDNYSKQQTSILYGKSSSNFDPIYKSKSNAAPYFGLNILDSNTIGLERSGGEDNIIEKYITNIQNAPTGWFDKTINYIKNFFNINENLVFSIENIQLIKDAPNSENGQTKYGLEYKQFDPTHKTINYLDKLSTVFGGRFSDDFHNDAVLLKFLKDHPNSESSYFLLCSLFTFSKTIFTTDINQAIDVPALFNVPASFLVYSGALLDYETNFQPDLQPLFDAFKEEYVRPVFSAQGTQNINLTNLSVDDIQIIKDLPQRQYLSSRDQAELRDYYLNFFANEGESIYLDIVSILEEGVANNWLKDDYLNALQNATIESNSPIKKLYEGKGFVNYSELTLNQQESTVDNLGVNPNIFVPLSQTNINPELKTVNDVYFNAFIRKLVRELRARKTFVNNQNLEISSSLEDTDIKNQCYYSFKSISDKWLSGFGNASNGFPFNPVGKSLIDQFIFVDRAFNDIGDKVVINLRPLLEYENDYDSSVFSVMSRILALNGFEFFPLQNFMSFNSQDWEDSFRIWETLDQETAPAFVCMYVGGVSSKLKAFTGDDVFDDDGIGDISNQQEIPDFWSNELNDCNRNDTPSTDNNVQSKQDQTKNTPETAQDLQFNQVKAFRVRFGEQDQAVFKNIHLDTREFKDTNESLAILSEIAQDESYATPVPKGQNLFNTFEQRSYSCTVDMLGDMMIQPTQYFQLENIPLFSGAYLILNVEHEFTANHASTSFTGIRILKYPVPYVTDFASTAGLKSNDDTQEGGAPSTKEEISQNAVAYVGMNQLSINAR